MKIAVISTYPPDECGIGIYTKNLVEALLKSGATVEVITFQGYNYTDKYVKPILRKNSLGTYVQAANYIKRNNFDRILIQHEFPFYNIFYFQVMLLLLKLSGKKVNVTIHTIPPYTDFFKKSAIRILHSVILFFSDQIILHTNYARKKLVKSTFIMKPVRIMHIPVNKSVLKPQKILPKKKVNVLCFGFIGYEKGLDIACEALGGLRNVKLTIAGRVHPRFVAQQSAFLGKIKDYARKFRNIKLINSFIPDKQKISLFRKCDFVLLPYIFIEQSAVLTEAWSYYKIPICSNIPAFLEELEGETYGINFKSENPAELRKTILKIASDVDKQRSILKNIGRINKERSFESIAKRYLRELV